MTRPLDAEPVLPLDQEARITIRQMRIVAAHLRQSDSAGIVGDSRVLEGLADALERSLNHTGVVQR